MNFFFLKEDVSNADFLTIHLTMNAVYNNVIETHRCNMQKQHAYIIIYFFSPNCSTFCNLYDCTHQVSNQPLNERTFLDEIRSNLRK